MNRHGRKTAVASLLFSNRSFLANKTRLLLIAGALFSIGHARPALAQYGDMNEVMNRIHQLETQIQTMSRAVYRGEKIPEGALSAPAPGASASSIAAFEQRLGQIEDQQKNLTGQLEKMGFDVQQMKTQVERMQADVDQRFNQMHASQAPAQPAPHAAENGAQQGDGDVPDAIYDEAFAHIRDGRYEEAEKGFKNFLRRYPDHDLAANAEYWLGETYYVRGDYKQSAKTFARGYQKFPTGAKAGDSLLTRVERHRKIGKKEDACLSLRQLQKDFHEDAGHLQERAAREIKQLGCP